ncbi:MAG: hypothetical protein GY861_01030 [bacterium]|nr:hypothetical protein [bacterium]
MPLLIDKNTKKAVNAPIDRVYDLIASGRYDFQDAEQEIGMINKDGVAVAIPSGEIPTYLEQGYTFGTTGSMRRGAKIGKIKDSAAEGAKSIVEGALDTGTFGVGNLIGKNLGWIDPESESIRAEEHPIKRHVVGGGLGILGSFLIPGAGEVNAGKLALTARTARAATFAPRALAAGTRILEKTLAKKLRSQFLGKIGAYATEGSAYGVHSLMSEAQLGRKDIAAEKITFNHGFNTMLFGALTGGGIPIIGKGLGQIGKVARVPNGGKILDSFYNKWGKISKKSPKSIKKWLNMTDDFVRKEWDEAHDFANNTDRHIHKMVGGEKDKAGLQKITDFIEEADKEIFDIGKKNKITDSIRQNFIDNPEMSSEASSILNNYFGNNGKIEKFIKATMKDPQRISRVDLKNKQVWYKGVKKPTKITRGSLNEHFNDSSSQVTQFIDEINIARQEFYKLDKKAFQRFRKSRKVKTHEDDVFPQLSAKQKKRIPAKSYIKKRYESPDMFDVPSETQMYSTPSIEALSKVPVTSDEILHKLMKTRKMRQELYSIKKQLLDIKTGGVDSGKVRAKQMFDDLYDDIDVELFRDYNIVGQAAADNIESHALVLNRFNNAKKNTKSLFEWETEIITGKETQKWKFNKVRKALLDDAREGDMTDYNRIKELITRGDDYISKLDDINYNKIGKVGSRYDFERTLGIAKNHADIHKLYATPALSIQDIVTALPPFLIGSITGLGWGGGAMMLALYKAAKHPSIVISTLRSMDGMIRTVSNTVGKTADIMAGIPSKLKTVDFIAPMSVVTGLGLKGSDNEKIEQVIDNISEYGGNPEKLYRGIAHMNMTLEENTPELASALGQQLTRTMQFIMGKVPQGYRSQQTNGELRIPDTEKRKFLRYLQAVSSPNNIMTNIQHDRVSNEELEVLDQVFPTLKEELRARVIEKLSDGKLKLDYKTKMKLHRILDIDAGYNIKNMDIIQGNYRTMEEERKAKESALKESAKQMQTGIQAQEMRANK